MKGLFWGIAAVGVVFLLAPISANAATSTFVGCDDEDETPTPSHVCHIGDFPGAFFESSVDTEYDVCVEFPGGEEDCALDQFAEGGVLYVNTIFTELEGDHFVSWYVGPTEVGSWLFRMDPVPPPPPPTPTPVLPPVPPLPLPAVTPTASVACLKAKQRVKKFKGQLRSAKSLAKKKALRAKLRNARTDAKIFC